MLDCCSPHCISRLVNQLNPVNTDTGGGGGGGGGGGIEVSVLSELNLKCKS